ncbi:MAG: hypothetical protein M1840_005235 [Geoglossum simile]|nr:MAG: hypothetical protein M1840_005235 [Geoglossum simile]
MGSRIRAPIGLSSIREDGLSELEVPIFNVFDTVLRSNNPLLDVAAAEELNRLCPSTESGQDAELYLWTLWDVLIRIAGVIPHDADHPGHETLVAILQRLQSLQTGGTDELRMWEDLPLFEAFMKDDWINPASNGAIPGSQCAWEWRNLNSFASRCLAKFASWGTFALWQLRDALEEEQDFTSGRAAAECNILAASEWVNRSGWVLFHLAHHNSKVGSSVTSGSLYRGKPGLSRKRWDFWGKRFGELGQDGVGFEYRGPGGSARRGGGYGGYQNSLIFNN